MMFSTLMTEMAINVRVVVDHKNDDGLASELVDHPAFQAACPQPGQNSQWLFFGSASAAKELRYYVTELNGGDAVVYRFPIASVSRKGFLLQLLAMALGCKFEDLNPSEIVVPVGHPPVAPVSRSVTWLSSVFVALSQGRLYDASTALDQFRELSLKDELGDLAATVSAASVLFARVMQTELEFLHSASRKHDLVLAEQFVSEGYFRSLATGKIFSIRADLARLSRFERRLELLGILEPTRKAFLTEVARNRYGTDMNRVLLIQTAFYCKCAADELAMLRPNEAFALVIKGFECLAIWENIATGAAYFYDHRLLKMDHTKFEGLWAAWTHSKSSLTSRIDTASYTSVEDLIETRNLSRVGHGLSVLSSGYVTQHLALLTKYVEATARVRGVTDYYQLLTDGLVLSGFCQAISSSIGEHLLKDHRVSNVA